MAKPIVLVYFTQPEKQVDYDKVKQIQGHLTNKLHDYHVIVVPSAGRKEAVEMEVYNSRNLNAKGLAELKKIIEDSIPKNQRHDEPASVS